MNKIVTKISTIDSSKIQHIPKAPYTGRVPQSLPIVSVPPVKVVTGHLVNPPAAPINKERDFSHITNEEFIAAIFQKRPDGAFVAVCSRPGDPTTEGGWFAKRADRASLPVTNNNYVSCSSLILQDDGNLKAIKDRFAAYHFIMLDDIGTKIPRERFGDFEFSFYIETSPENFQAGIILVEPLTDIAEAERLLKAIMAKGLSDEGASGLIRWARLPIAINGKEKHKDEQGKPFQCRLVQWRPDKRYSPQEIFDGLKLDLQPEKEAAVGKKQGKEKDDVFTPKLVENPVITALKARGLYKKNLGTGKHDITCPWLHEHTDGLDSGTAYFEPSKEYLTGGFRCQHSHGDKLHIRELQEHLGINSTEARNKPVIRIVAGELHRVVDAAELELANCGKYYQAGGLIVSVSTNPTTGDPSILPTGISALTRQLSDLAIWEKSNSHKEWVRSDPPSRHISILYDSKNFNSLLPLAGVARQPYFRASDGELVIEPGYDKESMMFGVFDSRQYVIPDPTEEAARSALALLEGLLPEFHFMAPCDKAAALSAIFTAVVRPTLSHAPAYHIKAPVFGSGKTYLCELIGAFAGPGGNAKVSYPKTSEEATKAILSLLLTNPAVIEFDDMDSDWIPHGIIMRMLTAEHITDRILGYSKTATVSTRTLFLGSGNNVGPVRDLLRRVVTIHVDPRCATPAMIQYNGSPVETIRKQRGLFVSAVLTIILAWRKCGSPRSEADSIVTYSGAWTEYCRLPLMWLGHPDPATALLEQVRHDPDGDALGRLMFEWNRAFGSIPTTVRKVVETAASDDELLDAMKEFPIDERGTINRSKFGWILKKNANRIVGGFEFQKAEADGRTAWRVITANNGDEK